MSNTFTGLVRIGSDPETRFTPAGKAVLSFSAASTTGFGDKKQTMWLRVAYWNNAEKMAQYLAKGNQIVVSGELSMREYQSNGETKTSLELNANVIDLVGGNRSQDQGGQQQPQQSRQQQRPAQNRQQQSYPNPPGGDEFSDDIPFAPLSSAYFM